MNKFFLKLFFVFLALIIIASSAYAVVPLDYPHGKNNGIQCDDCHYPGTIDFLDPEWVHVPQDNIDDTPYNNFCLSCHDESGTATVVATHSSLTTGSRFDDWSVECRTCHWPHHIMQYRTYGADSFVISGQSTTVDSTSLFVTGAGWTDDFAGMILIPNLDNDNYNYNILSNTEDTIYVSGSIDLNEAAAGDSFAIVYNNIVQSSIDLSDINTFPQKSGVKEVKFFNRSGMNSFADEDPMDLNGICEVCHTQTDHFRNDGGGNDPFHENMGYPAGTDCTICHSHQNGFRGMGGGAHDTHVLNEYGPKITCVGGNLGCHGSYPVPLMADGLDLANTAVCDNCHSEDGAVLAKQYWNTGGSSLGSEDTWRFIEGDESYCGSCHDSTPGTLPGPTGDITAPDIAGDGMTYGFFVTGHGKTGTNYEKLSWQETGADGNPPAERGCADCHDLTTVHIDEENNTGRMKPGFENDDDNSNCNQCHNDDLFALVNANSEPYFYTNYMDYTNSAHTQEKCSNCHDPHGVGGHTAMTWSSKQDLCFTCHTEGVVQNDALSNNRVGGHHSADDIEEAFGKSEKHDLGTAFNISGKDYTLECVSCHNVHLITGRYWDAEDNRTPVTRFPADKRNINGDYINLEPWGDAPGEKMDDFAALGSGSGGFYYNIARGFVLGDTGLPFDQDAVYQPPKSGDSFEFGGDMMPDYTSFCLDCHTERVSAANPPINWGQGIGCTDNSVDPPDQRIECGAQHGLGVAGKPYYVSDEGTAGFWGNSGNPDALFNMNYVTRGRHNGNFMRWPYDSADRSAGINFVLSCTDCHEAHGSNRGSMIRERFNVNANGDCGTGGNADPDGENCSDAGNWNSYCNACHYYYGGHHAGMSCGNASCHETNSIHRIIHVVDSGASTQLMLTAAGYESNYIRPDFTPDIVSAEGHIGSDQLTVTFASGVWSNVDMSLAIDPDDFWLFDVNRNETRTITNVVHNPGDDFATLTLSSELTAADLDTSLIAMKKASAWNWYEGGYVNAATGTIGAQVVSAGPWPVAITGPPPFNIQSALYGGTQLRISGIVNDSDEIYVTFAEGAYSSGGGDLQAGDFVVVCGGRTISSVTHTAGDSFAILTLNTVIDPSEVGVCTVAAAPDSVFDSHDNPAGTDAVTLAMPPEASADDMVLNWNFNEDSGTIAYSAGALGTQEDMHGVLTRNVVRVASTKPGATVGDNAVLMDRVSDKGAVQLNYPINPDDGFPPATYRNGGAPVIVQELEQTSEFSFSVWIKPTALGCDEGKTLGLNTKLRRDILTTQFWIKNWALGIMRFSDDGDPISGNCTAEDSTHDVLRFWVAVGDPSDMRCDAWGGSWPEYVHPVSPAGYKQGNGLMPTDQTICDNSVTPILPTNTQSHSFAQTETSASGVLTYGVSLQPGVWQHVVGTWDGQYIRIYIDGQLAAETDMGGTGDYIMVADPHLWGGDMLGDGSLSRHVSSGFGVGARPTFSSSGSPSGGAAYWDANGFYTLNNSTYVGELDDVKYWGLALPSTTIQNFGVDEGVDNDGDGYTIANGDCNDNDPAINPDTLWYQDSDGDGFGNYFLSVQQCLQPSGSPAYVLNKMDYDDNDTGIGAPVRIAGTTPEYFGNIYDAYMAASEDDTIEVLAVSFTGNINIERVLSVALIGGYSNDFSSVIGDTVITGTMTISGGEHTIENFIIQQ